MFTYPIIMTFKYKLSEIFLSSSVERHPELILKFKMQTKEHQQQQLGGAAMLLSHFSLKCYHPILKQETKHAYFAFEQKQNLRKKFVFEN